LFVSFAEDFPEDGDSEVDSEEEEVDSAEEVSGDEGSEEVDSENDASDEENKAMEVDTKPTNKKKDDKKKAELKEKVAPAAKPAVKAQEKETPKSEKKRTQEEETAAAPAQKKAKAEFPTQTIKGGIKVTDLTPADASAQRAKAGQQVQMRYIGRLTNGTVFDSNTKGAPFSFKLGKGEVITGWDLGIVGMAVGQRRKLVIPPKMGYGARGAAPDIPPNATLEFEVKLLAIRK
jgi:FK506-binding nuclear protein